MAHPYLRAWAVRCLGSDCGEPAGPPTSAISAPWPPAAAIRAGLDAATAVPVTGGAVHLPGLGRLQVAPGTPAAAAQRRAWAWSTWPGAPS